ncbi:MAG: hypothetical protein IIA72_16415 [Proteobacteria bacterium]|nr:hypothetical protein [Pseudomonadota bacterium]
MADKSEDQRLTIERRLAFLEEWRTNLTPIQESIASADRGAIDFALAGLKSGFLLNGGALIALPAFIEIFKLKPGDADLFVFAAIPFALGLITCTVANFLGYKCANTAISAQEEARSWRALRVTEQYYPSKDRVSTAKTVKISQDKSDKLFLKARKEENIGQKFFIVSISLFVIGVVYSLAMWVGIERILVMGEPNFIFKLLDVLASWPVAVFLIALVLRQPILTLIGRWRPGKGRGNGGPEPKPPDQEDTGGPSTEKQLSTTQADHVPAVENLVKVLRQQLDDVESTLDIDRETALLRALARSNLREHFERTYRIIWGSQIQALQNLNSVATSNVDFLRPFYDAAANKYPSVYEKYLFDDWLRFLEGQLLLIRKGDVIEITTEGQEFLKYLVDTRVPTVKAW